MRETYQRLPVLIHPKRGSDVTNVTGLNGSLTIGHAYLVIGLWKYTLTGTGSAQGIRALVGRGGDTKLLPQLRTQLRHHWKQLVLGAGGREASTNFTAGGVLDLNIQPDLAA